MPDTMPPKVKREAMKLFLFNDDIKRLESVKGYIDSNLEKDLSIGVLATFLNTSQSTLRRHFTRYFQQTIYSYILKRRMEMAMVLLLSNELSIKQTSKKVGYKRLTSFTHAFSKYFGHAPIYYLKSFDLKLTQSDDWTEFANK